MIDWKTQNSDCSLTAGLHRQDQAYIEPAKRLICNNINLYWLFVFLKFLVWVTLYFPVPHWPALLLLQLQPADNLLYTLHHGVAQSRHNGDSYHDTSMTFLWLIFRVVLAIDSPLPDYARRCKMRDYTSCPHCAPMSVLVHEQPTMLKYTSSNCARAKEVYCAKQTGLWGPNVL